MGFTIAKVYNIYKIQILASITIGLAMIALKLEREPISFTFITLGALVGTFILDIDYLIYAFFIEPKKDFSTTVRAYIKHKDFSNTLSYIHLHRHEVKEKTLIGAIFQIVLAATSIFVVTSPANLFIKALVLSVFVNSMYRMWEYYFEGKISEWFWGLKVDMNKNKLFIYTGILVAILGYSLSIF